MTFTDDDTRSSVAAERTRDILGEDYVNKGSALSRLPRIPFEVFLLMLMAMLLMIAFGFVIQSKRNEAEQALERVALTQSEAAASNNVLAADNDALVEQVAALEATIAASTVEAEAADIEQDAGRDLGADPVVEMTEPANDAGPDTSELEARVAELEAANAALVTGEADAVIALDELLAETDSAAFVQFVGEILASEDGVRIDPLQGICLGRTVIDDIGLEAIGAGVNSLQDDATNSILVASMVEASEVCGIDPQNVFGD